MDLVHGQVAGLELRGDRVRAPLGQPRRLACVPPPAEQVLLGDQDEPPRLAVAGVEDEPLGHVGLDRDHVVAVEALACEDLEAPFEASPALRREHDRRALDRSLRDDRGHARCRRRSPAGRTAQLRGRTAASASSDVTPRSGASPNSFSSIRVPAPREASSPSIALGPGQSDAFASASASSRILAARSCVRTADATTIHPSAGSRSASRGRRSNSEGDRLLHPLERHAVGEPVEQARVPSAVRGRRVPASLRTSASRSQLAARVDLDAFGLPGRELRTRREDRSDSIWSPQ